MGERRVYAGPTDQQARRATGFLELCGCLVWNHFVPESLRTCLERAIRGSSGDPYLGA